MQTSPIGAMFAGEPGPPQHVVYCFDQNYEQHFGASVTSLLLNRRGPADLHVHVVIAELSEDLAARLGRLAEAFRVRIDVHVVPAQDLQRLSGLKTKNKNMTHLTTATYYRVLLPNILPPDIGRALYIDSDTIVLSDLRALHDVDLGQAVAGAAVDKGGVAMAAQRGLARYVNTGVLVMDLQRWRDGGYVERCLDYALHNPDKISYGDQCAINAVCADALYVLEPRWNRFVVAQARPDDPADAAILHFITGDKPWQAWYENKLGALYWRYLDVSPWAGAAPVQPTRLRQAQRLARLRLRQGQAEEAAGLYEQIVASLTKP